MKNYRIALLPGDGIGKEVVPAGVEVLKAAAREFTFDFASFEWSCEYYLRHGRMMPQNGLETLRLTKNTVPSTTPLRKDMKMKVDYTFENV